MGVFFMFIRPKLMRCNVSKFDELYRTHRALNTFLNLRIGLGLYFIFVCLSGFSIFRVFCVSLNNFIPMLLAFVAFGLVSSVGLLNQETGWEERLQNDLFCVESDVDVKP